MIPADDQPRLLVLAYACEPGKGSEQGVGWNWALQLARFAEVTVITRANNREVIEAEMARLCLSNPSFAYHDPPRWVRSLKRGARGLYPFYLAWQWGSYRLARRLAAERPFTHVLQLTMGSIWMPVFAHRLPGRFVWGPVGGAEGIPPQLLRPMPPRDRALETLRRGLRATLPLNPFVGGVLRRASRVLVRTRDTFAILPAGVRSRATVILETAVSEADLDRLAPPAGGRPAPEVPTVLFTGRLMGSKNVGALLEAAARARTRGHRFRLRLLGDGPERRALERQAERLGLSGTVEFAGLVPHAEVLRALREADIYAFPSLREGGPWSLMEAMCAGLPVICVDTAGMSVITDEASALRVAPASPEAVVEGFAEALGALCASPELRARLGAAARRRMRDRFLWDRVGEEAARLVLGPEAGAAAPGPVAAA